MGSYGILLCTKRGKMSKVSSWQILALSKLVKEYDQNLMLDLSPNLFSGHHAAIFNILQHSFLETGKIPSFEALQAGVRTKAPRDILPVVEGVLKAINMAPVTEISKEEIVVGLKDQQLIAVVDSSIKELVDTAQRKDITKLRAVLNEIVSEIAGNRIVPMDFQDAMEAPDFTRIITSGIEELDEVASGIHGLTLIAARSGAGKSVMLLQLAIEQYLQGHNILFISLELSARVLGQRMKAYVSGIDFKKIIADNLTDAERELISESMKKFFGRENTFKVVTTPMDALELKNLLSTQKALFNTDAVYVDYLNLIDTTSGNQAAWLGLQTLARDLHKMTVSKGITIISAVQVNIDKASKAGQPPVISTRGSSELFFSASLVIFLEAVEDGDTDDSVFFWILKNRLGPTCCLLFQKQFTQMRLNYVMEM